MTFEKEFEVVEMILDSQSETRGVDAFSLALIKSERQMRRLVTFLVFQSPHFRDCNATKKELRETLADNRQVYFPGLVKGFDALSLTPVKSLVGARYCCLDKNIKKAVKHRNKIFHGQLTGDNLTRTQLIGYVKAFKEWCMLLADASQKEIGYDGFERNSFQKSNNLELSDTVRNKITSIADYQDFLKEEMQQ